MQIRNNVTKYLSYVFETRALRPVFDNGTASEHALRSARQIRGDGHGPAVIIHGIMPRSGTVYVGELLRLHPDLRAYPHDLWEVPFLQLAPNIADAQAEFLWRYRHSEGKLGEWDFLPLFAASFLAYLHADVPQGQRMLIKVPSVKRLDRFFTAFPHEHLLVLVRDGRDVVQSTTKTWPQLQFSLACRRWNQSARMVMACDEHYARRESGYWLARFEDAVREPEVFVREACRRFGLDEARYPWDKLGSIPIQGSSSTVRDGEVVWDPVNRPKGFDPTGRWKSWSGRKKWTFKRIAGKALVDLGYCADLSW
jgi:protein-tyrosine sulfotransferase